MRIEFEFSGGYAGLFVRQPLALSLDSESLPAVRRDELAALVESSGIMAMEPLDDQAPPQGHQGPQRDVFNYSLSISRDGATKAFRFDDVTAPAALQPLLGFLRGLAIERQGKPG